MAPARKYALTKEQTAMYRNETLQNFRTIAKIMSTYASYTLSAKDLAPVEVKEYLSEIGEFAEITYSTLSTGFIFDNLATLMEPGFPLEGYHSVRDSKLLSAFTGKTADLPGYLVYRPHTKQLVLAFSGTATVMQAVHDLRALHHRHPSRRGNVHSGFWKLYKGIKSLALEAIRNGLAEHSEQDVTELVITGHSMGAAVSQLLLMDILRDESLLRDRETRSWSSTGANFWTLDAPKYGEASISEYSVKAYNDGKLTLIIFLCAIFLQRQVDCIPGVPSLPPLAFGYRHYARSPFYFLHGRLYHIPVESREYALFHVTLDPEDEKIAPEHPRGGHNYYNGRDMEKFARRTIWVLEAMKKGGDWKERYRAKVAKHAVSRRLVILPFP
ncbi:Triacylglycerol lipase [Mycena sanguinolenta]|uniref:Triacylglycerol lipase n=1 Tax=Mycena sanguinolenta TaxID=230812 RepID=A0A8H7CX45_9AGAR|nr:Triacylglycerol lipase [Mycena sanguinolenta]